MNTNMKKLFLIAALALSTLVAHAQYNMSEVQMPFQSTSSMPASGSKYASTPTIGENGTATYNGASYSPNRVGPRRTNSGDNTGTPGGHPDPGYKQPIGDCPIELLIAFTIICIVTIRIRSNKCKLVDSTSTNG
jgi:hypothetical protein